MLMAKLPEPCDPVPPEVKEMAVVAEQRKDAALVRLQRLADGAPEPDAFDRAMRAVIDADKAYQKSKGDTDV